MSVLAEKALVAQLDLKSSLWLITDRPGISLDGFSYVNIVRSWGEVGYYSDTEEGQFQIGALDIELVNGEEFMDGGYLIDPTDVWNNQTCTVKLYDSDKFTFNACIPIINGKIKNFNINDNIISFSVEQIDERDDTKLPAIVCVDQTSLADADARFAVTGFGLNTLVVSTGDAAKIVPGEMVLLILNDGDSVYNRVDTVNTSNGFITFYQIIGSSTFNRTVFIEKAFRNIPKKFINKTIPIQIGDLDDSSNGVFGKAVTTSEFVGKQKIAFDYTYLNSVSSIGVWENKLVRYFIGRGGAKSGDTDYEYEIDLSNNAASFLVDSTVTLFQNITSTSSGIDSIQVTLPAFLQWVDESDLEDELNFNELLSINIIAIDNELMMIMERPPALGHGPVWVERGYAGTTITTHSTGAKIYQSAKYAGKNLLKFTERFTPKALTGFIAARHIGSTQPSPNHEIRVQDIITSGKWTNVIDNDTTTYVEFNTIVLPQTSNSGTDSHFVMNFNAFFPQVEENYKVVNAYIGINASIDIENISAGYTWSGIYLHSNNATSAYDTGSHYDSVFIGSGYENVTSRGILGIQYQEDNASETLTFTDTYSTIRRAEYFAHSNHNGTFYEDARFVRTELNDDTILNDLDPLHSWGTLFVGGQGRASEFGIKTFDYLNKKWKFSVHTRAGVGTSDNTCKYKIYNLGVWLDFFIDFTQKTVVAPLEGRKITADVSTITGAIEGNLCSSPVDVLALLLTQELRYTTDDFTSSWESGNLYGLEDWTKNVVASTELNTGFYTIIHDGNRFLIMTSETAVYESTDGITWDYITRPDTDAFRDYHSMAYGNGMYVAVSQFGSGAPPVDRIMYSSNASSWTIISPPGSTSYFNEVIYENGLFVAVGVINANIVTSPDGITWTERFTPLSVPTTNDKNYSVAYGSGRYVIVGIYDSEYWTLTSTNGFDWSYGTQFTGFATKKIKFVNGRFFIFATTSTTDKIHTSTNGTTWTELDIGSTGQWKDISFGRGHYIIIGVRSATMHSYISQDLSTWTLEDLGYSQWSQSITYANNIFVAPQVQLEGANIYSYSRAFDKLNCAFSYGVDDDRIEGFDFCQKLANHYNYLLTKDYDNKIDIVNVGGLYSNVPVGNEINIERDVLFLKLPSKKRMVIYQTGNDLIYNDIIVKYKRNNSTGEYQANYTLPDTYTLAKSGITLATARDDYYDGRKRTLEIESDFIYDETYAQTLAEYKANEFAEVHFYVELFLDFDHYTNTNSLTEQYKIGDVMYFSDTYGGIAFTISEKFYIKNVVISDNGREIQLQMKSLNPVTGFTPA